MKVKNNSILFFKNLFTEHWKFLALNAACNVNLFDFILSHSISISALAKTKHFNSTILRNLIKALEQMDLIKRNGPNSKLQITSKGMLFTDASPQRLKYACMNWAGPHLNAWQNLDYTLKTGKSSFKHLYGCNFFDYLNKNPKGLDYYHKAMYEYARDDYKNLADIIDFSKHESIMDVGGGYGAAINIIQRKNSKVNCILFDLPKVIIKAPVQNVNKISGNFFKHIPNCSAILLTRILHDWDNEHAHIILNNCSKALPIKGTLYIIENCSDLIKDDLSLLSLNMSVMCHSYERSSKEYIKLAKRHCLNFKKMVPLNALQSILIFKKGSEHDLAKY